MGDNKIKEKIKNIITSTQLNFLIGAGCSYNKIEGKLSYPLMSDLLEYVKKHEDVKNFMDTLDEKASDDHNQWGMVRNVFQQYLLIGSNVELFLSVLEGVDLYIFDEEFKKQVVEIQNKIREIILERIMQSDDETVMDIYSDFYDGLRKVKENLNEKNSGINIFTTNYDMLNEKAMENLNIHYYAGFYGIANRKFNLSYYNYQYIDNFEMGKNQYIVNLDNINLYKLHGSISWYYDGKELIEKNPYEVKFNPEIIYPSIAKFENTNLVIHYSALMREFADKICRKDTTLIVSGTSLGDEHINKIIENALTINSFTLIIFVVGNEEYIELMKRKYEYNHNVIVYNESTTFEYMTKLVSDVCGVNNDE